MTNEDRYCLVWKQLLTILLHWTDDQCNTWISALKRRCRSDIMMFHETPQYYMVGLLLPPTTILNNKDFLFAISSLDHAIEAAGHLPSNDYDWPDVKRRLNTILAEYDWHLPVQIDPSWLTPTVMSLAQTIYDERAFEQMPILADALEESGCDNADMLTHCRSGGEHVRGCWLVDLVLGKR